MLLHDIMQIVAAAAAAAVIGAIVLPSRINEGVVIKLGLILMIGGFLGNLALLVSGVDKISGLRNAALSTHVGVVVVFVGVLLRQRHNGHPMSRSSDWGDRAGLDDHS